jgi:hypothetical protein
MNCREMQVTSARKRAVNFYISQDDSIHFDGAKVVLPEVSYRIQFPAVLCATHYRILSIWQTAWRPSAYLHPFLCEYHEKCAAIFAFVFWKPAFFHSNIKIGNNFIRIETSWTFVLWHFWLWLYLVLRKGSNCAVCCLSWRCDICCYLFTVRLSLLWNRKRC